VPGIKSGKKGKKTPGFRGGLLWITKASNAVLGEGKREQAVFGKRGEFIRQPSEKKKAPGRVSWGGGENKEKRCVASRRGVSNQKIRPKS